MYVPKGGDIQRSAPLDKVKRVQKELKKLGYYNGDIDGDYGGKTKQAVQKFQKDNGLTEDGIVGPETGAMLNDKYGEALEKDLESLKEAVEKIEKILKDLKRALGW